MDESIEKFKVGDYTVFIYRDETPSDPRDDDNLGTMVCWHRRYQLGDKHKFCTPQEFEEYVEVTPDIAEGVRLPLYLYDHSGITMSTGSFGDPWDSGQVGWIYAGKAACVKEFGKDGDFDPEKVAEVLRAEVETYDQYLTGDIYGYVVSNAEGEVLDSCWGFHGMDCVREEATAAAEYEARAFADAEAQASRYMAL